MEPFTPPNIGLYTTKLSNSTCKFPEIWKDAQGDDLPDYDREVVVLVQHVPEYSDSLRVSFGHRPNPKGYVVVKGEKLYARTYDKGWNQPNVRYWLDARLPYEKDGEDS